MYIDTHTHLTDRRYEDADAIIRGLKGEGISYIIGVGYDLPSSQMTAELADTHQNFYGAVGVHPHDAGGWQSGMAQTLEAMSKSQKIVAIGEIGLDYHYPPFDKQKQADAFMQQLELAHSLKLPVIIHLRDAAGDLNALLKQNSRLLSYGGVMHCYSQSAELVPFYQDLGLYISFAGPVTFANARGLLDAVRAVPLSGILTETDCPYLTPEPHRGKLNYPAYVRHVAQKVADLKGVSAEELCENVRKNAARLFTRIAKSHA